MDGFNLGAPTPTMTFGTSASSSSYSGPTPMPQMPPATTATPANGSANKRARTLKHDDLDLDDILGQITSKLDNLSTRPDDLEESKINAFLEVLKCTDGEASFYLESAGWVVESAVALFLENSGHSQQGAFARSARESSRRHAWGGREVSIEGLDPEWTAKVSRRTGQIYFFHEPTAVTQSHVPAGFDDAPPPPFDTGDSQAMGGEEEDDADINNNSYNNDNEVNDINNSDNNNDNNNSSNGGRNEEEEIMMDETAGVTAQQGQPQQPQQQEQQGEGSMAL